MSGAGCSCSTSLPAGSVLTQDEPPDFVTGATPVLALDDVVLTGGTLVPLGPIEVLPRMNQVFAELTVVNFTAGPSISANIQGALVPQGPWAQVQSYSVNAGGHSFLTPAATMQFPWWRLTLTLQSGTASLSQVIGYGSRS